MENSEYNRDTLVKLRRQYSENETIQAQARIIAKLNLELGKERSYISELEDDKKEYLLTGQSLKSHPNVIAYKKQINDLKKKLKLTEGNVNRMVSELSKERNKNN